MGVAQGILSAMVFWDAGSWDPPSQASMQQLSAFEAKVARRAINALRQAGRTTDAQLREMLNLPAIPSAPHGSWQLWMQIALCRLKAADANPLAWTESVAEDWRPQAQTTPRSR